MNEISGLFTELEKAFAGPGLVSVMKILNPQQLAKAISIAGARKRGDMVLVERAGREFLSSLSGEQMTALGRVVPAGLAAKISSFAK